MINRWAAVLSYPDRSGIIQAFGPFDTAEQAQRATTTIPDTLPAISSGLWEVVLVSDLETDGVIV